MNVMTSSRPVITPSASGVRQVEDRAEHDRHDDRHERDEHQLAAQPMADDDVDPARDRCIWTRSVGLQEPEGDLPNLLPSSSRKNVTISVRTMSSVPWRSCSAALIAPSGVWRNAAIAACSLRGQLLDRDRPVADRDAVRRPAAGGAPNVNASGPLRMSSWTSRETGPAKAMTSAATTTRPGP